MICVGLDEVGRGPFFGSLFCGAVIWDNNKDVDETKEDTKVDNLRISKSNEVKPEIKKVKKQETEKRVGEMIKQSLSMIFLRNEAKVPNLETNTITVTSSCVCSVI